MHTNAQNLTLQLDVSDYNGYNISCFGGRDGAIDLTITGGTPPYQILWSTRDTVEDLSGLASGYYRVEVSDNSPGEPVSAEITLTEPEALRVNLSFSTYQVNGREYNISLNGACNGWITANPTGGVEPYAYHWEQLNGSNQQTVTNLCAMEYFVIVTDANGCQQWNSKLMTEPVRDDWTMNGNAGSNPNTQYIGTSDQTDFVFRTNSTERLRIKANGEMKISSLEGSGDAIILTDENGVMTRWGISIAPLPNCPDPATFAWQHRQAPPNSVYTCWERVGINTSYPLENLQIGDQFTFHSGGSKVISFNSYYDAGTQTRKRILASSPVSVLNFHENGSIEFTTAPTGGSNYSDITTESRLFVGADGRVGIGTSNPATKLEIKNNQTTLQVTSDNAEASVINLKNNNGYWHVSGPRSGEPNNPLSLYWNDNNSFYKAISFLDNQKVVIGDVPSIPAASPVDYQLYVGGGILCERLKVALKSSSEWSDYVFEPDYKLMPLNELKEFIEKNKHLPGMPSANEVAFHGIDVAEMNALLLKKIEELTLYVLELKKRVDLLSHPEKLPIQTLYNNK